MKPLPEPTLRRLPIYHQYLKTLLADKRPKYVSSGQIGDELNIVPIQVRKDLAVTEAVGKSKLGYDVVELIQAIEAFLGWNSSNKSFLVGVGNLGSALLGYQGFREYGLNIVAAFDADEKKVGTEIHGVRILHVNKLPDLIKRMGVRIGILTVPGQSAQELADIMVTAGIYAIWNFSPVKINVPPHTIVQHENLASSLVVISKKLAQALKAKA